MRGNVVLFGDADGSGLSLVLGDGADDGDDFGDGDTVGFGAADETGRCS